MISIEETKELINRPNIPNEEADEIRKCLYDLANLILEKWKLDQKSSKNGNRNMTDNSECLDK